MEWVYYLLIGAVFCFIAVKFLDKSIKKQHENKFKKIIDFNPTYEQTFLTKLGITGIAIDENSKKIAISSSAKNVFVFNFDDIEDAEIELNKDSLQTSSLSSQALRGATGAVLFGPAGLIIGALSGKKLSTQTVSTLALKISVNNIDNPVHRVVFYDSKPIKLNELDSHSWAKDAESWVKRIITLNKK